MEKRIAVTGFGALCSLGATAKEVWDNVCQGKSAISSISNFDVTAFRTRIAGEIKDLETQLHLSKFILPKDVKKLDNSSIYGIIAAQEAMDMASIPENYYDTWRCGTLIGTGIGGLRTMELQYDRLKTGGPSRVSPFTIPKLIANMVCGNCSIRFGLHGPSFAAVSACASGAHAIGAAIDMIRLNRCDMVLCGAAEAAVTPLSFAGFCAMRAMSERNDDPQRASRPFDKDRDGFLMSDGAGMLVLEDMEMAKKRGAKIYAEIVGYASTSDANHITSPLSDGQGGAMSMRFALKEAKLNPEQIGYINTHGTSTPLGDISEVNGIKAVFGDYAKSLPISSTKSETGHLLGASGSVEAIFSMYVLNEGIIPPTINVENQDPECDLDVVPNVAREKKVDYVLSNNFGFGGHNATLIFKKFTD